MSLDTEEKTGKIAQNVRIPFYWSESSRQE